MSGHDRAAAFIRGHTTLRPVLGVEEISLHLADDSIEVWSATETEIARGELDPPFWAFAWAGGQLLARWLLDHPDVVAGRPVHDLATGSGLVAIAAAMAGAGPVSASDLDPLAVVAARLNAGLNRVRIDVRQADALALEPPDPATVVLVADVFYQAVMAERLLLACQRLAGAGCKVLIGDPGRSYLPRDALEIVDEIEIDVDPELESTARRRGVIARLRRSADQQVVSTCSRAPGGPADVTR